MKYIDSDKLIAEIERRRDILKPHRGQGIILTMVLKDHYNDILSFITSLQQEQPDVGLEKEITKWIEAGDITDTRFDDYDDSDIERTALHFYELGLNAKKNE